MKNIEQRNNELRKETGRMFRKLQPLYIEARRAERLRNVFALTAASTPWYCEEPLAQTGVAVPPSALNTIYYRTQTVILHIRILRMMNAPRSKKIFRR